MEDNSKNLYEIFSKYNAEKEGDVDIIKSANPNRPDLKYLKWMRGWQEVLKVDPNAEYYPLLTADGSPLHHVGIGGMVHVNVKILGQVKSEWYPIESSPMKSVAWENITPSQVNKAIKRGMVKCLALFGLASNLYLNEDMTEGEKDAATEDIASLLANAESVDDLLSIYNQFSIIINRTPKIKLMFTARKNELTNKK